MIHDIILALGGIGGEVLKDLLNEETFMLSFAIHYCEKTIVTQLISIAENYKVVNNFMMKVPHFGEELIKLDKGVEMKPGMYLRAFCSGLHESLQPYRSNLVTLEKDILDDPHFSLSGILAHVSSFSPLLTTLKSVINQVVAQRLHGCQILQLLHQHLSSGIAMVDEAMARIMRHCHMVMLKQLTGWLLYGNLVDPYNEFFIEACLTSKDGIHSSMTTLDSESPDNLLSDYSVQEYRIVEDLVPSYLPPSVPEKAKFIGSTVLLFLKDPRRSKSGVKTHNSVYQQMESSLVEQLKSLQNSKVLDISSLETVLDNFRACVTQHLFSLAKDEGNLVGELRLIKDFYLLGRGELFISFLREAQNTLVKAVSHNSNGRELSYLLYAAARNAQLNSDEIMKKFTFFVSPKDAVGPGCNVWSVMSLDYKPPWPLHLLFTPPVLTTYNTLFDFLLQVKLAELHLHDVWIDNMKRRDKKMSVEVCTLRNSLMFLVHSLQCYLQLDVLESEFSVLAAALDRTKDFEQVIHQHSLFLTHITAQAFLLTKEDHTTEKLIIKRHPVNKCLVNILKLCDDFCLEVWKSDISGTALAEISTKLDSNICLLMNLITFLGDRTSELRLLLLRLDYNSYFSRKNS